MRARALALSIVAALAVGVMPLGTSSAAVQELPTPLMGPNVLTASEMAAFYDSRPFENEVDTPVEDLAKHYIEEGQAAGIRGDLAFAQALHETGWFEFGNDVHPDQYNFAGLGATGGVPGNAFETAQEGVRAHIHHLKAYADPRMAEYMDYPSTDPGWLDPGPVIPIDMTEPRFTYLGTKWPGSYTTVESLTGSWAADTGYHPKVLKIWDDMLAHAGKPGDIVPLSGDWDGDDKDTPGWFLNGRVTLSNADGSVFATYKYGRAGDLPVVGDWDGDGDDTLGIVRGGHWHLRNRHRGGEADIDFKYGRILQGDYPLTGDWNGNGRDTVGIVRQGEWHLRNSNSPGHADIDFIYGRVRSGDLPLTGDWTGDGEDTPAIVRGREWHLRFENGSGEADQAFKYGAVLGDAPVPGNWDGDGDDTPGVARGTRWLLRNDNTPGDAHASTHFHAR